MGVNWIHLAQKGQGTSAGSSSVKDAELLE
jgi:hypothetical protein